MERKLRALPGTWRTGTLFSLVLAGATAAVCLCPMSQASPPWRWDGRCTGWEFFGREPLEGPQAAAGTWYNFPGGGPDGVAHDGCGPHGCGLPGDVGGTWFWMRSPEQERVVVASLFNRYCIRCHGVDGRGVWDIPGVPDFTNERWQLSRSDAQIARIIIEGRGAVMPSFRGALTLEEAWAMARYLRTFPPGATASKPDLKQPPGSTPSQAQPEKLAAPPKPAAR